VGGLKGAVEAGRAEAVMSALSGVAGQ
jgi:hypothetical protein